MSTRALHLNLDDAWSDQLQLVETINAREWGPRLRFTAPGRLIEQFYSDYREKLAPFILYGSGDFHHLTALWIRRVLGPLAVVSFDNHPDWDVRPPKWGCGGWVNRALELPQVEKVSVWGCGNFETWWPRRIFGNRGAERAGRLDLYAWADGKSAREQKYRGAIFRATWRERFEKFLRELKGMNVYITIDLDCLRPSEAITNWENGRFTGGDLEWALSKLRESCQIIGGDICGAFSTPSYARRTQRFVSEMDHPKLDLPDAEKILQINSATLARLWPALTG